jgi:pyridoxine 4-dehydrogenase
MGFTWRPKQTPDEEAFAAMKKALSLKVNFWNAGEFYGAPDPTLNLQLINRYFTKYPEDADKVVLSVKGGLRLENLTADGSPEGVRRSIDNILRILDGKKHLDIFECARVDPNVPIQTTISTIAEYVKAGKISGIGLSEASVKTIRAAHEVHPIAGVEAEVSLWATDIWENGVADACRELGIPIIAYSPLGRGFLTGEIKSVNDIPEGDFRRHLDRFQPENFAHNLQLVESIKKIAERKGITVAQVALAWIRGKSKDGLTIIPIPGATNEKRVEENSTEFKLTVEEENEIEQIVKSIGVVGGRYNKFIEKTLFV